MFRCTSFCLQLFAPLFVGASLVIASPQGHMDADYIVSLLVEHDISFFMTVPALGLQYYSRPAIKQCHSLRSAMFIGEPMPMELVHLIHQNVPQGVGVYNTYGANAFILIAVLLAQVAR